MDQRHGPGREPEARREQWDETRSYGGQSGEPDDTASGSHKGVGPRTYRRADRRIHDDIADRMSDDRHLDATEIEVQVFEGEVTLKGMVGTRADRRRAEELAEDVSGVRHITNDLRIRDRS